MEQISLSLLIAVVFVAGFGWGQWWAERQIRAERTALESGRISVSMPVDKEQATATMGLLKTLMEQVEQDKANLAR